MNVYFCLKTKKRKRKMSFDENAALDVKGRRERGQK
jgi:hypothetical protein